MKNIAAALTASVLALVSATGCAVDSGNADEDPSAADDLAQVSQAFNTDFCATGTDANDTENITVSGQRANFSRGPGWMNGSSLCPEPRKTTIVDFNVNSSHNEYEYEFFTSADWGGTIPVADCTATKIYTRIQYKDRQTGAWVQTDYDESAGVVKARIVNGIVEAYCDPPSYAGHFRNLRSSAYGDVLTQTFRVRTFAEKKSGYYPLVRIQGHNLGDY